MMTLLSKLAFALVVLVVAGAVIAVVMLVRHGVSARDQPTTLEAFVARRLRHLAVPRGARQAPNPVPATPDVLAEARAHFADHCASCHGNDGSGQTEMGQHLYPKAPDMRQADTQSLSDGELFYIIHNGIRLSGMPAWGDTPPEDDQDSWKLVHFIRHLPKMSPEEVEEMKKFNPQSPQEKEEEETEEKFLQGEDSPSSPPHHHH
ncbi:MAG TPA: c-type cytochrome [Candidatus Binatia bacterium]|nr:c-type cytochrome [Candidatus Binatia bacterium]